MFPGPSASVYRNEAGEVLGWDYPSRDDESYDPDDYLAGDTYDEEGDEDHDEEETCGTPNQPVDADVWCTLPWGHDGECAPY